MHIRTVFPCVTLLFLGCCTGAMAQSQFAIAFDYHFPPEPLDRVVRDALDLPYGKALLTRFAGAVTKAADPACLRRRKLDSRVLAERGRGLFLKYGTGMLRNVAEMVDAGAYAAALRTAGEPDAAATLDRLTMNADVKRLMGIVQPARLATVGNFIFEEFDHYNLLSRRKFPPTSLYGARNDGMADHDPTDDALKAAQQFIKSRDSPDHYSPDLQRFVALSAVSREAIRVSVDPGKAMASGPRQWFQGADKDLAALCVKPPPK